MSDKLKLNKKNNDKIILKKEFEDYYIFDFKYITTNNKYNFKFFKNNIRNKSEAYDNLMRKIIEISKYSTKNFNLLDKKNGLETIKFNQLNFKTELLNISDDDKFISIRFQKGNYRLICIKSSIYKNILHIIGFDFDYSAYQH